MGLLDSVKNTKTVLFGVSGYTSSAKNIISKYGNENINDIRIYRQELSEGLKFVLSAVSLQDFNKKVKETGHDKLYHLGIIIDTNKGRFSLEKNDTITLKERPVLKGEDLLLKVSKKLSLNQLLSNTQKYMGNKYFTYDAIKNNCQDFILSVLKANHLNNIQTQKFVKQDNLEKLFSERTKKIVDATTETGGRINTTQQSPNPIIKAGNSLFKTQHIHHTVVKEEPEEEPKEEERKEKIEL